MHKMKSSRLWNGESDAKDASCWAYLRGCAARNDLSRVGPHATIRISGVAGGVGCHASDDAKYADDETIRTSYDIWHIRTYPHVAPRNAITRTA